MSTEDERRAKLLRLRAAHLRAQAATYEAAASSVELAAAFRRLAAAFRAAEVNEVQQHPDLAELDAQLNGFYAPPSSPTRNGEPE